MVDMTPLEHAAGGIGIAGLKALASKLLKKLPKWLKARDQQRQEHEVILRLQDQQAREMEAIFRFQTDVHYLINVVDRMQDRQGRIIERQQEMLCRVFDGALTALDAYERTGGADAGARVVESITSAHEAVRDTFQHFRATPAAELAASLEVVARWQMTYAPHFRMCAQSLLCAGETMLACVLERHVYYLTMMGTDPSAAQVKYLAIMLTRNPMSSQDWSELLDDGSERLDQFVPLPGDGVYDLARRLEQHAIRG